MAGGFAAPVGAWAVGACGEKRPNCKFRVDFAILKLKNRLIFEKWVCKIARNFAVLGLIELFVGDKV